MRDPGIVSAHKRESAGAFVKRMLEVTHQFAWLKKPRHRISFVCCDRPGKLLQD